LAQDENPQTYVDYAEALAKLGDPNAETMLQRAMALNADIGMAPYGEWLLDHHQEPEVLKVIPSDARDHYPHFLRGVALERLAEPEKALVEYLKFQDPEGVQILFSEAFPAPVRFRIPGSRAQAEAGIRFDDKPTQKSKSGTPTPSPATAIVGLAYLISGEAGGENRGSKRGVGWEVRNRVLRGAVQLTNSAMNCPGMTNQGSNLAEQYISVMCYPNQFVGMCSSWCTTGVPDTKCATLSQESQAVANAVYYGFEPDPVGYVCPGGYVGGSPIDYCASDTRCNGDLQSYSLSGALFNYGPMPHEDCPNEITRPDLSCLRTDTLVGRTCSSQPDRGNCFYNNYYVSTSQHRFDGAVIPVGGVSLPEVKFRGYVPYQSTQQLRLEIELRNFSEYGGGFFGTDNPTQWGIWRARSTEEITVQGLIDERYHWRARLKDQRGNTGAWVPFGGNSDTEVDFQVATSCQAASLIGDPEGAKNVCGGSSLSVSMSGTGTGHVLSNPVGIDCPGDCGESFSSGTQIQISASPSPGSTFSGWSGDPDCADGSVTMNGNRSCSATFMATTPAYTLTVSTSGAGTVSSIDGGINCGGTCSHAYVAGTTVTLTASAASGWSFSSWSGNCSGGPVVQVAMSGNRSCMANFVQVPGSTPETTTGNATNITATSATLSGTINPHGLSTTGFFEYGPDPGLGSSSLPQGVGMGTAFVPFSANVSGLACATTYRFRAVGVNTAGDYRASNSFFTTAGCPPQPCFSLSLLANGDAPAPIASPSNSSGCPFSQFHAGEHVSLSVSLVPGDVVVGWGGTDNDSSTATVNTATMPSFNQVIYAHFEHVCYHLNLGFAGSGNTPAVVNPVGYCPTDYFPWGYEVHVIASPATGWTIGGWSGTRDDTTTSPVNFILMPTGNHVAFVQYVPLQFLAQVVKTGNGIGTVVSDLPGINCGPTCSAFYPYGTTVILTATADAGSIFGGWSGACAGGVVNFPGGVCYPTFNLQQIFSDGFENGDLSVWQTSPP
jgi:hypothetical protein